MTRPTGKFGLRMLLAATLLLTGCADMPAQTQTEDHAAAAADHSRAFGRVQYLENGKEVAWRSSIFAYASLTLYVRPLPDGALRHLEIEDDGSFNWPLQAGEHVVVGYQFKRQGASTYESTGRLMTSFSVPKAGRAVYVGDMQIAVDRGGSAFKIVDRYAEALGRVEARLTRFEKAKGIMRPEPQPGTFGGVVGICVTAMWQLDCQGKYQGVEPLRPSDSADAFPLAESLTPALEWKPTGKAGVTYDVAIFEALKISGVVKPRTLRGPLVSYAQGLRDPKYSPAAPLQPGKLYEWTVRLREGDTVSSWSTSSYSWFALVAASKGAGRSFGFSTPDK